jgi:hypothetical protein
MLTIKSTTFSCLPSSTTIKLDADGRVIILIWSNHYASEITSS